MLPSSCSFLAISDSEWLSSVLEGCAASWRTRSLGFYCSADIHTCVAHTHSYIYIYAMGKIRTYFSSYALWQIHVRFTFLTAALRLSNEFSFVCVCAYVWVCVLPFSFIVLWLFHTSLAYTAITYIHMYIYYIYLYLSCCLCCLLPSGLRLKNKLLFHALHCTQSVTA